MKSVRGAFKVDVREKAYRNFSFFCPRRARKVLERFYFRDQKISVKQAPEASDILWNYIGSKKLKHRFRIKSRLYSFMYMFLALVIIVSFKFLIRYKSYHFQNYQLLIFNLLVSLLVGAKNIIIQAVIRKFAAQEQRST